MAQRTDIFDNRKSGNPWLVGTREVVYMAIGAALYALLNVAFTPFRLPGPYNIDVRPSVAIPLFFGSVFGPVVGFFVGCVGNLIGDMLTGGFYPNWDIGNGLMGLVAGLLVYTVRRLDNPRAIALAVGYSIVGILVGMAFAAVTDFLFYSLAADQILVEMWGAVLPNVIVAIILIPILAYAWENLRTRTGQ